mgnify:CR=1 FL=1
MSKEGPIDIMKPGIWGHVTIRDSSTGEILLDMDNSIHFENFSVAVARSLAGQTSGFINTLAFGNGGSMVDGVGDITYLPPNTTGMTSTLYNQTYEKTGLSTSITGTSAFDPQNTIDVNHMGGTIYSDMIFLVTMDYGEPSDQNVMDNGSLSDLYVFDEMGLISSDGHLLSHVIFNPIQKSLNRKIEIEYTVRIAML